MLVLLFIVASLVVSARIILVSGIFSKSRDKYLDTLGGWPDGGGITAMARGGFWREENSEHNW
jgi:hypothetical protein